MLKLNISGLLKKCKEIWSNFLLWWSPQNEEIEEEEEFVLEPVREFFESYIGVFIVGFTTFQEDVPDLEQKVQARLLMDVRLEDEILWLKLSKINGKHGGYIKIIPSINGQFAERNSDDEPIWASRYRIKFYGEDSVEYIDPDGLGNVSYFAGFRS